MINNKTYIARINNVLEFIDQNLQNELSLESVSKQAYYSPYHFHRIFTAIIGEPLNAYIVRKRLEKAASLLLHKNKLAVSEIAINCGFTSNASFTRSFNKFYGLSPTLFRKSAAIKFSKIGKVKSKNGKTNLRIEPYIRNITNHLNWIAMNANIEVKELPDMQLVYVTQIGMNSVGSAFEKLMRWAGPKGILASPNLKAITIYHDSPKITSSDKVRVSACFSVDQPLETAAEISKRNLIPGKCIVARMTLGMNEFQKSWEGLFVWMADKGYEFDNERDPFEIHHNNFNEHPEKKSILDLCIPVK